MTPKTPEDIRRIVRHRYGDIAAQPGKQDDYCCAPTQSSCCNPTTNAPSNSVIHLYEDQDALELPLEVTELSLGCGDPIKLASLEEGQAVLDLGSGGGIDCFLAAKKVGPSGKVIGVDMTAAMIEKARSNKAKLGYENVEFRLGEIEHLPVADQSVDVIISNCVINLSPDKPQVFREAFRTLRPGGRIAVSDIVTQGPLPDTIKSSLTAWASCIAGALQVEEYVAALEQAGFVDIDVVASPWDQAIIDASLEKVDSDPDDGDQDMLKEFDPQQTIFSARIVAYKPE
jgi:SAM-dependent methyltransferase